MLWLSWGRLTVQEYSRCFTCVSDEENCTLTAVSYEPYMLGRDCKASTMSSEEAEKAMSSVVKPRKVRVK